MLLENTGGAQHLEDSNLEKSAEVRIKINPTCICYLFHIRSKFSFTRNTRL